MDRGKTTVSELTVKVGIAYEHILDFRVVNRENTHGKMFLLLEVSDTIQFADAMSLQGTSVTVELPDGRILFSGICKESAFSEQADYKTIRLEVYSHTIVMDEVRRTETYQSPTKKLDNIVGEIASQYGVSYKLHKNPSIQEVVYQKEETDWTFIRRLANQFQQQLYAETRSITPGFVAGTKGLAFHDESVLGKRMSVSKDMDELRRVLCNGDSGAASYQFEAEEYLCENLTVIPGDVIGRDTVKMNRIINHGGILENRIALSKTEVAKPKYELMVSKQHVNSVLTGKVIGITGNTLQVQFDTDAQDMAGNCVDVPYESPISNSFYCMPDIGDKVFVYYENNGKIVCLGSKRNGTDHPDYLTPQEKSLTAFDKMLRFTSNAVKMTTTRKKHDAQDDTEITILLDDTDGITITSGTDITIETTDGTDIFLDAHETEKVPEQLYAALEEGQKKFLDRAKEGNKKYVSEGGMDFGEGVLAIFEEYGEQQKARLKKNAVDTFTFPSLRKAVNMIFEGEDSSPTEVKQEQEQYARGVLTLYGLNTVMLQVQSSLIVLDTDAYINGDAIHWLGYKRGEHDEVVEEYQDWFAVGLDVLQFALDIGGMLPLPVGVICDLANAAISLARGDVCGAALSLVGAIPLVGDAIKGADIACTTLKTAAKMVNSTTKIGKAIKVTNVVYSGVMFAEQIPSMGLAAYEIAKDGKFDWDKASEWQKVISILRGFAGIKSFKDGLDEIKKPSSSGTGGSDDSSSNRSQTTDTSSPRNNDGADTPKQNSDTTSDPINVITGSLLAEYVDLSIEDILGSFDLKRCYESAFHNTGGLLGDKWRYEIESSVCIRENYAIVQLPDLHIEKFHKQDGIWENLRTGDKSYVLLETEEGYIFRKKGDRTTYQYNKSGQLTNITDRHGNSTQLQYSGGMLERIQVSSGQWISFRYEDGRVVELEDSIGRTVRYTYQGNYLHTASLPNGGTMRYDYTKEGFITCAYDLNGKWYTRNYYDRRGRVIRQELAGGEEYVAFYDDANRQNTFLTTSNGDSIIYQYGVEHLARKIIHPDQTTIEKHYDAGKNIIYEKDRRGNEIFRTFHEDGMLLEEKMPDGLVKGYEYDEEKRLIRMFDNAGRETLYEYDSIGNRKTIRIRIDDGRFQTASFTHDSKGRILSMTDGEGNTEYYSYDLPISSATKYVTQAGDVIYYNYDKAGRLLEVEDEMGKKSYGYNNFGQRTIMKDEEGNTTRFYYDSMANLVKKIRPNAYDAQLDDGEGTVYQYDVWENLTKVIYPDGAVYSYENDFYGKRLMESGPEEEEYGEKGARRYQYDSDHNRIRSIYPDGAVLREQFDANGNLTKRIIPEQYDTDADDGEGYTYEYDSCNRLIQITNPLGIVEHRYVYDLAGNLIKDIDAKGYQSADTDEERTGTLYRYDLTGQVTEVRTPLESTAEGMLYKLTVYDYDTVGNCVKEKRYLDYQTTDSARGRVNIIQYSYDHANRLVRMNDSLGACMEYAYNCRNQRTMEKRKISENIWQERHYFYFPSGRIQRIMDSADEKGCGRKYTPTYFSYDKNGNLTSIKTESGYEILREYDICDRLTGEIHRDKNGTINHRIEYSYDLSGNLIEKRMQDGYTVNYNYDVMGRLAGVQDSRGATECHEYDKNGNVVCRIHGCENEGTGKYRFEYDMLGRNISVTAPDGELEHYTCYNAFGEKEKEGDGIGGIRYSYDYAGRRVLAETESGSRQTYQYDAVGNIIALEDGNGNRTVYETDSWGRIIRTEKGDGSVETYTYDHAGNITTATDGNGNTVSYRYNSLNRMAARVDGAGYEETFLYDMNGRLCEHRDREGKRELYHYNLYGSPVLHEDVQSGDTESWEYDGMGRLKSAIGGGMRYEYTYYPGGLLKEKKASGRVLVAYEYDQMGRKTAQSDLTGKKTEYHYHINGMLAQVVENENVLVDYNYFSDGTIRSMTIGKHIRTDYTYDKDKNTTGLRTASDDTILVDNVYHYDLNGNRIEKRSLDGLTKYSYDANNRLVEVQYPNLVGTTPHFERLSYDGAGNRIMRMTEEQTEQYRYDNCNRLLELRKSDRDTEDKEEVTIYSYDRQGNLLSDGNIDYIYDGFNRVVEVTTAQGEMQQNRYDAEGLRYEMVENGKLVQFLYSEGEIIAEKESDGNIIRYIRGLGLVSSDSEKAKTYYHYLSDEQGSITHILEGENKCGEDISPKEKPQVLNRYTYDAFGNVMDCEETVHNRFRFLGEQQDPITQQYYLRARYYNPVIGRFTQEDTYYGDGLNLYQYCGNNPVRYKDPSGHGSTEQNPYKRYTDVGADPDTAKLASQAYPDAASKKSLVDKYKAKGYNSETALMLANYEIIHGTAAAEKYANNVKKSGPDTTKTSPRDNLSTDWRTQNKQTKQSAEKGGESGTNSIDTPINSGVSKPREVATPNSIYEQMNPDGTVKSRAFYDENGNRFSRQDFDHRHFDKKTKQYYQPHEHNYSYNENGQPTGKSDGPLPKGYSNKPTN